MIKIFSMKGLFLFLFKYIIPKTCKHTIGTAVTVTLNQVTAGTGQDALLYSGTTAITDISDTTTGDAGGN